MITKFWRNTICRLVMFVFLFQFFAPIVNADNQIVPSVQTSFVAQPQVLDEFSGSSYIPLMRRINKENEDKDLLIEDLNSFLIKEKEKLVNLPVDKNREEKYLDRLRKQINKLQGKDKGFFDKLFEEKEKKNEDKVKIPDAPSHFGFNDKEIILKNLNARVEDNESKSFIKMLLEKLTGAFILSSVQAQEDNYWPKLIDLNEGQEVVVDTEIKNLAESLNYNPVDIYNFLQANIVYEPYFGSKKGSSGCLMEKVCNDTDTASLAIALLRASGIPARYKKSAVIVPVSTLKNLLGVDQVKTVYAALAFNNVPVFLSPNSTNPGVGGSLDNAYLEDETELALEWTFVESFYEYDEKGANIDNTLFAQEVLSFATDEELKLYLQKFPKKQWFSVEFLINRWNEHKKGEILADTANFNTETFWYNFLQYQGVESPLEKYAADLQSATGKSIYDDLNRSIKSIVDSESDIIPFTLPYSIVPSAQDAEGNVIDTETWPFLPDARKNKLTINLLDDAKVSIFSKSFFTYEINNESLSLFYEGSTEDDKLIIESYGGIFATPAELVKIKPVLRLGLQDYIGDQELQIGDTLILEMIYQINNDNEIIDKSQKYSIAGNKEGIFVYFSKIAQSSYFDSEEITEQERNQNVLTGGNGAIAREYLMKIEKDGNAIKNSLDYEYNIGFARAVVTQNRILSEMEDGTPTTFDFSGLSIDASVFITDYSNRGDYKIHQKDFRLLFGLNSSFYESVIFKKIGNLEAVSTVTGLQFAYANPQNYTIHVIDQNTPDYINLVNGLSISGNAKEDILKDIAKGNKVITPDKFVENDNWRGVLYISLDPKWTGTYAIGEQVQNGGYTFTVFYNSVRVGEFYDDNNDDLFIFHDKVLGQDEDRKCRILKSEMISIMQESGYEPFAYGLPCYRKTVSFGEIPHTYIVSTAAAKFYSPNKYNYWIKEDIARAQIKRVADNYNKGKNFNAWFSLGIGTYLQSYCTKRSRVLEFFGVECRDSSQGTIYYTPSQFQNEAYLAQGDFLYKLGDEKYGTDNYVVKTLGFPLGEEKAAAPKSVDGWFDTTGKYQDFVNGQLYKVDSITNFGNKFNNLEREYYNLYSTVTYVSGKFHQCYNNPSTCVSVGNTDPGSWGRFGFPVTDPALGSDGAWYQKFQNGEDMIRYSNGSMEVKALDKYYCGIFKDSLFEKLGTLNFNDDVSLILLHGMSSSTFGIAEFLFNVGVMSLNIMEGAANAAFNSVRDNPMVLAAPWYYMNKKFITEVNDLIEAVSELDSYQFALFIDSVNDVAADAAKAAKQKWYESFGPGGCKARQHYLKGYFYGEVLQFAVAFLKLSKVGKIADKVPVKKIKTINSVLRDFKFTTTRPLGKSILARFTKNKALMERYLNNWVIKAGKDYNHPWYPNAHHLIPQSFRNSPTLEWKLLIDDLDSIWNSVGKGKFDLNDGINGVWLPNKLHPGNHLNAYNEIVWDHLDKAIKGNISSQQKYLNVQTELKRIRQDILDANLVPNNSWYDAANKEFIQEVKNTKDLYN